MDNNNKADWRSRAYLHYVSGHATFSSRMGLKLSEIRRQYPVWEKYFGDFMPQNKEAFILDVGCGNGEFLFWLKEKKYSNYTGIDISKEQIDRAKELGVNATLGDLNSFFKNKKNVFDCIIARDVIEHLDKNELLSFLDNCFSSLKQNGSLIIQAPNAGGPFGARSRYMDFTHYQSFTENSLNQALLLANFKKNTFRSTGPVVHGFMSLIRFLIWKLIAAGIHIYLLSETGAMGGVITQNLIAVARK